MLAKKKKYLIKNPGKLRGCVESLPVPSEMIDNIEKLLVDIDLAGKSRQQLSRRIGALKKENQSIEVELAQMKQLSEQVEQLDAAIEEALIQVDERLDPQDEKPSPAIQLRQLPAFMQTIAAANAQAGNPDSQSITITAKFDDIEWNQYVSAHNANHIYHDLRWRDVIETSFAQKTHYLVARDQSNRIVGVLPLAQLQSALFGKFLISLPYFNYGGPLADDIVIARQLIEAAGSYSIEEELEHVELRETVQRPELQCKNHKISMILQLPESMEALLESLGAKLRSQTRRAERAGAISRFGGMELLDEFYFVFSRNMRDLGTPVYSKRFFQNILESFPNEACLHVVEIQGKPAAAGFLIAHRDTVEIPWASSLRRYNNLSVNMMLYRSVLQWSINKGFRFFDFGRSSADSATFRFKQQWGSEPVQLHWNYYLAEGRELPSLSPDNPKFALFIAIWKRLPVFASNLIGPHIVRNLP